MLFAVLEFSDFAIIAVLLAVIRGVSVPNIRFRPEDAIRLRRLEQKLDLNLNHLGIAYVPPPKDHWQVIADDPSQKIAAIKAYREQYSAGLADAKKAVDDYTQGQNP